MARGIAYPIGNPTVGRYKEEKEKEGGERFIRIKK
jgi:hypothetical protein